MASYMCKCLRQVQALRSLQVGCGGLSGGSVLCSTPTVSHQQLRYPSTKHYDLKWRKLRKAKVIKVDLPDFGKLFAEKKMSPDEIRKKMKKDGRQPPRHFQERPLNITSTGGLFEEFIPPEGDGKSSLISTQGVQDKYTEFGKKGKSLMQLRKLRQFEDDFDTKQFAQDAQAIVIEAQQLLQDIEKNQERLHDLVTEKAFPEMVHGLENKTFSWEFVESIEPPRVTHIRTQEMMGKDNLFAQVTIRMHTKQKLAIYDRFGRLMYGSESLSRDVLEYIVLEKHVANVYGLWRVHAKILPEWLPPRDPLLKTFLKPTFEVLPPPDEAEADDEQNAATEAG